MANKRRNYPPKSFWTLFTVSLVLAVWFVVALNRKTPQSYKKYAPAYYGASVFSFEKQKFVRDGQLLDATISTQSANASFSRAAAILSDNSEGSGTFQYVVGAVATASKTKYSQPVFLGDRIKVESLSVDQPSKENNGIITVMYLERSANAPVAAAPTLPVTKKFAFQSDGNLIEVVP